MVTNCSKELGHYGHYYSHQYQYNAVALIEGNTLRQGIIAEVKSANYFAIHVDGTKCVPRKEQLVILLRYISNGKVVERPIDCYKLYESLSTSICEILEKLDVDLMRFIAQCYDCASFMSGEFNGVQA